MTLREKIQYSQGTDFIEVCKEVISEESLKEHQSEILERLMADEGLGELVRDSFEQEADHYDALCSECSGETVQKSSGDEGWTYCSSCQLVEGETWEGSVYHSLGLCYNWTNEKWSIAGDEIGQVL